MVGIRVVNETSVPPLHDVDIKHLKVFKAVVECGGALGLTICKSDLPELEYRVVGVEHASMYCGRGHPAFRQDEITTRAILAEPPACIRRGYLVHDTLPDTLHSTNAPVAYHVEAMVLLLLTGAYVGIVPDQVAQAWVDSGELHRLPLAEFHTERPLFLVKREGQCTERAAMLLFDDIAAAFQDWRLADA